MTTRLDPTSDYPYASYGVDAGKLLADDAAVRSARTKYALGAKVTAKVAPTEVRRIDCSGYVYWLLRRRGVDICDGSQLQREWCVQRGLKESTVEAGKLHDGAIRIAILPVTPTRRVGHVALIHNGETIESHGGVGPNRRPWTGKGWQGECRVFVLMKPQRAA